MDPQRYRKAIKKLTVAFTKNVPHGKSDAVNTPDRICLETLPTAPPAATNNTSQTWSPSMNLTSLLVRCGVPAAPCSISMVEAISLGRAVQMGLITLGRCKEFLDMLSSIG